MSAFELLFKKPLNRGESDPGRTEPQIRNDLPGATLHEARRLFWGVFLFAFVVHLVRTAIYILDDIMWANQIKYFLNNDPAVFDFHAAYGHPGTTLVGLGSLFHLLFGLPFSASLTLSVTLLIAVVTAACASLCFLMQPQTLWWFTTGFILTVSRFYFTATPPTAAVMPFITLIVLSSCWLWEQHLSASRRSYLLWGVVLGLSAATRLDVSLFVGMPLFILLVHRGGMRVLAPVLTGGVLSFLIADPFLWFMPVQHVIDLFSKFTFHYSHFSDTRQPLPWFEWVQGVPLAVIAIVWFLVLLRRRRLSHVIPAQVLLVFLGISILGGLLLTSSNFKAMRYLFPLLIVWEVFLPLFALQTCPQTSGQASISGKLDAKTARVILGFIIPTQVLGYIVMFIV